MGSDQFATEMLTRRVGSIVKDVQLALREEKGESYDAGIIEDSIRYLVGTKLDRLEENLSEMFTSPTSPEFHELERIIESRSPAIEEARRSAPQYDDESVFNGHRVFPRKTCRHDRISVAQRTIRVPDQSQQAALLQRSFVLLSTRGRYIRCRL